MNVLINASNIRKSGALQVTLSFLEEVKKITRHKYLILVSEQVEKQIDISIFSCQLQRCTIVYRHTGKQGIYEAGKKIKRGRKSIRGRLCIFCICAVTYWTPKAPHLAGFANVWAINPDSVFINSLPLVMQRIKTYLGDAFRNYFIKRNTVYHVVEENDVKRRLSKYFGIKESNIFVVNNTYNHHFSDLSNLENPAIAFPEKKQGQFSLVTISSNFLHKNLKIIGAVSRELKLKGYSNIYFYVTIRQPEFDAMYNGDSNIKNLGVIAASDCPYVYCPV